MFTPQTRWAAEGSLHVTLRFFGPTSDAHVEVLRELVTSLAHRAPPLALHAATLTGFPDPARAHVLVVELEPDPLLTAFAERAEAAAIALGFAPETRAYRPHITLARMKESADVRAPAAGAARLPAGYATAITLYASTTEASGPVYTSLARATLPTP